MTSQTRPASPAALQFATDLLANRELTASTKFHDATQAMDADELAAYVNRIAVRCAGDAEFCSKIIDALKELPRKNERADDTRRVVEDLQAREAAGRLNDFGRSLLDQWRQRGSLSDRQIDAYLKGMERYAARQQADAAVELPLVPKGRYAVENAEGELRFYRVYVAKSGRVYIHVQHGPSESELPFNAAAYRTILQKIVDDGPAAAMQRYGFEIGACGQCGLRLTNRISRELGIGPVCGGRMFGDDWSAMFREARESIIERGEDPDEDVDANPPGFVVEDTDDAPDTYYDPEDGITKYVHEDDAF